MRPSIVERNSGLDRSLLVRASVALAAFALALVGCGSVMPGSIRDGAGSGTSPTAAGNGPGVTEDSVKVVFVGVDLEGVKSITGFQSADAGNPAKQVKALETWVNANGGIGGRTLDAVFRMYDAQVDSPAAEEQLCNKITQDDQAFAVVLTGQFQSNARPCYAQRETLVLDATLVATDEATYAELSPYLWSASYPSYDGFVEAYVATLAEQGFFDGREEVGVVAADNPINRATMEELAIPLLSDAGVRAEVAWVDTTDQGSLFQGNEQGAVTFRTAGIDRVMFLGGARLASIFATVASSQSFEAQYSISTFDNPAFFVNNPDTIPPGVMDGMVGVGFAPSQEVADDALAFPDSEAEQRCVDIYGESGITFSSREAARVALPYCDAALLLQAGAIDLSGDLNASAWGAAVEKLGSAFVPATGFAGALGPGRHAASGAYRVMRFDSDCGCFVYEGGDVEFPTS
ncbi:ABC-type branched-subunit amino acid transport system substrate-binding protein [Mumia flava]|uniref:ABC-type branched-subunit amino acid transport system substrate-binding protein n=1 Tax=Mumia flava TaxID=1348852 RepID=A0A0B2BGV9_9ACTN|nr:ABC transporter substrate-binding protein [Mumia flava]PJJ56355.1 ABC-type branched-subunit amino acid transport system substrate-binding protein [Mumia flava]